MSHAENGAASYDLPDGGLLYDAVPAERDDARERVTLQQGDVRAFSLGATYACATAPFRILQHLITIDDQLACLRCVARHVAPGGRFVFDVFNPSFASLVRDRSEEQEDTPTTPLDDGRTMRRTVRIPRARNVEQVIEAELIYYVTTADGETTRHVHAFDMRWYLPAELAHLLARAGFAVREMFGAFDRTPLRDDSPEIVVAAERLTGPNEMRS